MSDDGWIMDRQIKGWIEEKESTHIIHAYSDLIDQVKLPILQDQRFPHQHLSSNCLDNKQRLVLRMKNLK